MSESDTMFNEWDRRYATVQLIPLPIQVMTTGPLPAPSKCKSGLLRMTGTCSGWWKQSFRQWCGFKWGPHHTTSHLRSWLESPHQSVPVCAEECGDPLVQSGGFWQTLSVAAVLGAGPQVQRDLGLASEGVLGLCTLLSLASLLPQPEPTWPLRLVIRREHHQHDLLNTKASLIAAICQVFTSACGKGMLPVPGPYQGGDWGWR